ncbi:MAG: PSD1 and planctomycete cytochrome C domain-containing protein [Isosphaeraceae bacterium]
MFVPLGVLVSGFLVISDGDRLEYNRDIRPILSDRCFACHGPDKKNRKGDLRLDVREDAVRDRDGSAAIVPGRPDESTIIERVFSEEDDLRMPPKGLHKDLTGAQRATLKRWVEQGAEYQPHWAYVPIRRPPTPEVRDRSLLRNAIDAFVQAPLEARGIRPLPEADRRTLIRRVSLDLIGLPPTTEEIDAFLADQAPDAYARLVGRLLDSPHYGERMAQGWLDVARYADTVGYHGDQNHNAWAYRDYVIDAFNKNKPFDQFAIEQLAGDLLPNPTPEQRVATCFNRLNMVTREGGAQPKEYLAKYTADRIRTVGLAFLGSTLNCAECHDHKFDPFTTKDFYAIGAFFADVKQWGVYNDYGYTPNPDLRGWSNDHPFPPEIVVESPALRRRLAKLESQIAGTIEAAPCEPTRLESWKAALAEFLAENPRGWATPAPSVTLSPPGNAKKAAADAAFLVEDDNRVVLLGKGADTIDIDLDPGLGTLPLAAIRIELLPEAKWDGKITRSGEATTVRPSFSIVPAEEGGKPRPLAIRFSQADRWAPRYSNGFELPNVHPAWVTRPEDARAPHAAVFWLDTPAALQPGEKVRVRVADATVGTLRIRLSPVAPEVGAVEMPGVLARKLGDDRVVRSWMVRSTPFALESLARIKSLESEIVACRGGRTPVMVTESSSKPLTIRVLARGNWMDESGEICSPQTPGFLPKLPSHGPATRLDLAKWIVSDENPLTARVVVNRAWKQLFGNGLSLQVDDLGAQGDPPSHPELLDWLAADFRSDWDVKRMVKQVVLSHTYRQRSGPREDLLEQDPSNRWLACQNPRRLEAEIVRDNILAIAGLLNPEQGGPPCHPYQPGGYYAGLQFPDRDYQPERDERQYRRAVYMHWQRTFLHPMLANFDAPSREDCLAIRTTANSPQQALTLLNDPQFVEAARAWAARLLSAPGDDPGRLDRAFHQALARPIRDAERSSLLEFLDRARKEYRDHPDEARKLIAVGVAPAPQGDPAELAAWASVCRVILNLHETITRY